VGSRLGRLPKATLAIAGIATVVTAVEWAMGANRFGIDRVTEALGIWSARMPGQWWRLFTGVLINPAYRTRTAYMSLFAHWAVNMLILVSAGRRVERRLGPWAVVAACVAGALVSGLYEWARFPTGGPGGGTSGASFGILGAMLFMGLRAGGEWRRYSLGGLGLTVLLLSWMYEADGIIFHVLAMAGGAVVAFAFLTRRWRWPSFRRRPLIA
jgi:membrane associated rhomboid family serine protease